jgi:hypothetical protein
LAEDNIINQKVACKLLSRIGHTQVTVTQSQLLRVVSCGAVLINARWLWCCRLTAMERKQLRLFVRRTKREDRFRSS